MFAYELKIDSMGLVMSRVQRAELIIEVIEFRCDSQPDISRAGGRAAVCSCSSQTEKPSDQAFLLLLLLHCCFTSTVNI